jgi:DNA-binding response OmpR family regulator
MTAPAAHFTVIVFSHDPPVRAQVMSAVGRRPAPDLGRIDWVECATGAEVVARIDAGGVDLAILDGEAQPTGGMGIARQLKYEIEDCPPICVLLGRRDDRWLATWSLADATITMPIDPVTAAETVARLLRDRARGVPVLR